MNYFNDLRKGLFVGRPNRFTVLCTIGNRTVRAYLPNPGRLWELLFPGTVLYLEKHDESHQGCTCYTVVAVERAGHPIMLHTHVTNLVAGQLIGEDRIPGLEGSVVIRPEVTIGRSRFDFLLKQQGRDVVVEVKSCTLVGNRIAMFPDAVTLRGTRHVRELEGFAKEGKRGAVIFLVHWPKAEFFMPEWHTDLELSRALLAVKDTVLVKALAVEWKQNLELGNVRDIDIPWSVITQEAADRGSYIIVLKLKRDRRLTIGSLGDIFFRKGYYCYAGSAKENLTKRIERHRRKRKKMFWHIDYLRDAADVHAAIPVRASEALECEIAGALGKVADWIVPGFGSSDCRCPGHLFGMEQDPIRSRSFIDLLLYFRIDRLEKYLNRG